MAMKTSLVITGDGSAAKKAVDDLSKAVSTAGATVRAAAAPTQQLDRALDDVAASAKVAEAAQAQFVRVMAETANAARNAGAAQTTMTHAMNDNTRSIGQQKAGMFQLGQNLQDVGVQLSMGTDLMRVMAMQGGQLATAVDMIGVKGAGGRLAAFLAGPYGAVVLTATAILGPMAMKLFETGDAADKSANSQLALADALTKQKYATDAGREAIRAYNDAQEQQRKGGQLAREESLKNSAASLQRAMALRQETQELLSRAKAEVAAAYGAQLGDEGGIAVGATAAGLRVAAIQRELDAGKKAIEGLQQAARNLTFEEAVKSAKAAVDPIAGINRQYDRQIELLRQAAAGSDKLTAALERNLKVNERNRESALATERQRQQNLNSAASDAARGVVTPGEVGGLLKGQFGGTVTSTTGGKHVRNSYHYRGQAVDYVPAGGMGSTSKAEIRAYLEGEGINIRELLALLWRSEGTGWNRG